jgi:hypothetical protein
MSDDIHDGWLYSLLGKQDRVGIAIDGDCASFGTCTECPSRPQYKLELCLLMMVMLVFKEVYDCSCGMYTLLQVPHGLMSIHKFE